MIWVLFLVACTPEDPKQPLPALPLASHFADVEIDRVEHPVIGVVGGKELLSERLVPVVRQWAMAQSNEPSASQLRAFRATAARTMVRHEVLRRFAEEKGLKAVDRAELLAGLRASLPERIGLEEQLARSGQDLELLLLRRQTERWIELAIAEASPVFETAELQQWHGAHAALFSRPAQVQVAVQRWTPRTDLDAAARLRMREQILASLPEGNVLPSRSKNIGLGGTRTAPVMEHRWLSNAELPSPMRGWAAGAKPGERSPLFDLGREGFAMAVLHGHRAAESIPFEEARERIEKQLAEREMAERRRAFLKELYVRYQVTEPLAQAIAERRKRGKERARETATRLRLGTLDKHGGVP